MRNRPLGILDYYRNGCYSFFLNNNYHNEGMPVQQSTSVSGNFGEWRFGSFYGKHVASLLHSILLLVCFSDFFAYSHARKRERASLSFSSALLSLSFPSSTSFLRLFFFPLFFFLLPWDSPFPLRRE